MTRVAEEECVLENLKDLLSSINWATLRFPRMSVTDVIDIFIVAYLLYKLMVWIKNTRAWSLFKGVVIVLLVSLLAVYLRLNTVTWILGNAFSAGLVAIIILFQPEFRKVLEELGKGKINIPFAILDGDPEDGLSNRVIEEVIKSAKIMSGAKTGALILIEQSVAVSDHEKTGIPLDAVITSQLLVNIFENKTPLHDGAVIIRNNRIAAATCILPLTQNEIGHDLGTRHRAAVGASEVTDAYVLVVSEETGAISIAKDGSLYKRLSEEQIREMLSDNNQSGKKKLVLWKGRQSDEKDK